MNRYQSILTSGLTVLALAGALCAAGKPAASPSKNVFQGTWCVGGEGLIISFLGKDSIAVSTQKKDGTMQGVGTYVAQDSLLNATVSNQDLTLKLGFLYKIRDASTIRAKMYYLIVDGEKIDHPARWLRLKRCNPATFDFSDTSSADVEPVKTSSKKNARPAAKQTVEATSQQTAKAPSTKPADSSSQATVAVPAAKQADTVSHGADDTLSRPPADSASVKATEAAAQSPADTSSPKADQ